MIKAKYETRLLLDGVIKASASGKLEMPEDLTMFDTVTPGEENNAIKLTGQDTETTVVKTTKEQRRVEAMSLAKLALYYAASGLEYSIEVIDITDNVAEEAQVEEDKTSNLYARLATGKSGGHLSEETLANIRKECKAEHVLGKTLFPNA